MIAPSQEGIQAMNVALNGPDPMHQVRHLHGPRLSLWVARTLGHREAFLWIDHSGKQVVYLRRTDRLPYMPHENWNDCGPILSQMLDMGAMMVRTDPQGPVTMISGLGRWMGRTHQEAICRARVGTYYGDEVPE